MRLFSGFLIMLAACALMLPTNVLACGEGGECASCEAGVCDMGSEATSSDAGASLKSDYPKLTFESVKETDIEGIYEVVAKNNVFYYAPDGGYLFFGEIFKDGESITAKRKAELAAKQLDGLPLDKAVKIGDGKNIIIEVADPDCPFCRKAHEFLAQRDDITRYVFMYPLPFHKQAPAKARHILCSEDRPSALAEVMEGKWDGRESEATSCDAGKKLLDEHMEVAKTLGVRGTPAFWINGVPVNGANIPKIKKLLEKKS